jgi:hypothetical protein
MNKWLKSSSLKRREDNTPNLSEETKEISGTVAVRICNFCSDYKE